ncbi:hypothetical protein OFC56_39240, partial [Escherichia coli]|nr:hypothetical protein [Escherichia coli]
DFFAANEPVLSQFLPFKEYGAMFAVLEQLVSNQVVCHQNDVVMIEKLQHVLYDIFWNGLTFLPGSKETDAPINLEYAQKT